jgi:hypothetical protein
VPLQQGQIHGGGHFLSQHGLPGAWFAFNQEWALQLQGEALTAIIRSAVAI